MDKAIYIDYKHSIYWLSYEWFEKHDVAQGTINAWITRNNCRRRMIDGRAYIDYDSVPDRTRAKLPTKEEIRKEQKIIRTQQMENFFFDKMNAALTDIRNGYWRNEIQAAYPALKWEKVVEFARRATVFEVLIDLHNTLKWSGEFSAMFRAFNRVFPDRAYSHTSRLNMALKKAKEKGIISVAVDTRLFLSTESPYTDVHRYWAEYILSHNKAFSIPDCYEFFKSACKKDNLNTPSFSWFKNYYYDNKNQIERNRMGISAYDQQHAPHAKLIQALNVGDQWQMDGWDIPIYCKREDGKGKVLFFKYTLFAIIDSHSRKIIGHCIAESENRETILKALELAVRNTGILPYEMVSDNHSLNKTKEIAYLLESLNKKGVTWTKSSNPRRKVLIERMFRTLGDKHFKKHYGYIGQGVKTKMKNGRTQQELMDLYTKNSDCFLDRKQVVLITNSVIKEYNNSVIKSLKDTPNNRYEKSEQPNSIIVDEFASASLFNRDSAYKVTKGQITIKRGIDTYEYQLPAEHLVKYNGKMVGVCYADFDEIYLHDLDTGDPICAISQKSEIHASFKKYKQKNKPK